MEEVEGEKKSAAGEEGEGDDDEDAGGVENIDGGDFALTLMPSTCFCRMIRRVVNATTGEGSLVRAVAGSFGEE